MAHEGRQSAAVLAGSLVRGAGALEPSRDPFTGEWRRLWAVMRLGWSRGARPWFAVSVATATAVVYVLARNPTVGPFLWRAGGVTASLPLRVELARLPVSLLLATPYLPVWAACAQVLAVFGIGELALGRRLTIVVALAGHFGATLLARVTLDAIHGSVMGLTPALAHVLDTGPSAATTAVGACLLVAARMRRSAALLVASLAIAALVAPGVDGLEHLVALTCGLCVGTSVRAVSSASHRSLGSNERRAARLVRIARRLSPSPAARFKG